MSGADFWKAFGPVAGLLVVFVVVFFVIYGKQLGYVQAPTIDLISASDIVTDQAEVPITGVVHNTKTVSVAGKEVAVSEDGGFSTSVPVAIGVNTVEIVGGQKKVAKVTVKVTREEEQKSVTATAVTTTDTASADLADSGPVETVMGSFGLAALILSLYVYRKSLTQTPLQKAKNSL